ncbi:MAG: Type 1 glutamine amidotransferase-like domain-containing protein [Candidatus Omnitrophica bacterium]|nr:Type 1 glutamine amidotransferase-like domain-containing protein [Candidatus Omnitrophota bacterium]
MKKTVPDYLIAGGHWHNFDAILHAILKKTRLPAPKVAYIGAANGEHKDFFRRTEKSLLLAGAAEVKHARIDCSGWQRLCVESDIIFVSGGDVFAGMEILRRAQAVELLRRLHSQGKIFIGVSAGSIMLAKQWLVWPDAHDEKKFRVFPCLGIADVFCDTHDEPEWTELKTLVAHLPPGNIGVGLRSGSAIAVTGGEVEVITGKVDVIDNVSRGRLDAPQAGGKSCKFKES